MADRPEYTEFESGPMLSFPVWTPASRLTKEQLEAAERTRAYHLRKLQGEFHRTDLGDKVARSEA
jgi:hypothetical protein